MKYLTALIVTILSGCASYTPPPTTAANYIANACLHADDCANRPYPTAAQTGNASDEGLGIGSAGADGS